MVGSSLPRMMSRSRPAQNIFGMSLARTTARTSGSAAARRRAAMISSRKAIEKALSGGRASVMDAMWCSAE